MSERPKKIPSLPSVLSRAGLAEKLLLLVDELEKGTALAEAASRAGVGDAELDELLRACRKNLQGFLRSGKKPRAGRIVAYSDGASRGNPGLASCAAVLENEAGEEILRRTRILGVTTNNVAEYQGVILALESALEMGAEEIVLKLDSELVARQLGGRYKVKNQRLKSLFSRAMDLLEGFRSHRIELIPREKNSKADTLANSALDSSGQ